MVGTVFLESRVSLHGCCQPWQCSLVGRSGQWKDGVRTKNIGTFTEASETFGRRGFFGLDQLRFESCQDRALDSAKNVYGKPDRFGTNADASECAEAASKIVVQLPEYPIFLGGQFRDKV